MTERWLVYVDFTPECVAAARTAASDVAALDGELVLVRALGHHTLVFPWTAPDGEPLQARRSVERTESLERLTALAEQLSAEHPGLDVELALSEGDAESVLLREARAWHVTKIVVSSSGRSPGGERMSRVAERVARNAELPVLVVSDMAQAMGRDEEAFAEVAPG
jgi:nucleotide-binding universal stress UspA family protein